ncbi:MAG: PVC-type heme-binding CxxCH protein [Balneolaceae bacterium]|nr:PVC-type heme-binding CxxCH protein [Balneolaceae bacterium]
MKNHYSNYLSGIILLLITSFLLFSPEQSAAQTSDNQLHILFLGDDGHHQPMARAQQIIPYFASRGIYIHYTERTKDLNLKNLSQFDGLIFYGNQTVLSGKQESALFNYVNDGGSLVAIHSASAMFPKSDAYINLVGGAFKAHGSGTFSTKRLSPGHPVFEAVPAIESWDETYVHMKHNPDKQVLSVRVEDDHEEPWTWIRNQGEGRVFYTAWGHDERTWSKMAFKQLIEQGLRWSIGDWALDAIFDIPTFTFGEGELPYYPPGEPWGTVGEPIKKIQNPLPPEESRKHILVDPDFEVKLFASEEEVINPIDLTWDEQGRLWVTETVDYPNKFADNREGNDRIKILEDTDNDGKADKVTVFADGLNIPTSLVLYKDGVIVSQAPDFIYLKDTDGDDKADEREVLFTGWGTFDTHAGPSNLRYGFDNQIWGTVGYSAFEGTVGGEEHQFSSGFYRFQPDGSSLEYVSSTTNNTWGIGFNEEGMVFGSTANRDLPLHSGVPNRIYNSIRGFGQPPRIQMIANSNRIYPLLDEVRQVDQHGRYTSASGFQMYTARDFPEQYWNRHAFVSDPTGHLTGEFLMEKEGSSYKAKNLGSLLASQDEWFSPIQTRVGPDGALWVLDWYNIVIQHNPTPEGAETGAGNAYVNDLRDRQHARIYRVEYKNADHSKDLNLKNATPDQLVNTLSNDNLFWRLTAQRLLVERGEADVIPQLVKLIGNENVDHLGLNPGALHAIWTLDGLGAINNSNSESYKSVMSALYHPSPAVRRAALMTLPRNKDVLNQILAADILPNPHAPGEMDFIMPVSIISASDAQVRLAALLAVAEMPSSEKAGISIAELLTDEANVNDRWIRHAGTAAAANNDISFLDHVLQKQLPENADSTFKANVQSVVESVASHYALGESPQNSVSDYLVKLSSADSVIASAFIAGIASEWPDNSVPALSEDMINQLSDLRGLLPESTHDYLNILAERWGNPDLFGTL